MSAKKTEFQFEKSLAELEKLVQLLEQGQVSLEDSLKYFEKGVELTRACHKALTEAEQKVSILMEKNGQPTLETFEPHE